RGTIAGGAFIDNIGGAIALIQVSPQNINIHDTQFINCQSQKGGAVIVDQGGGGDSNQDMAHLIVYQCLFDHCQSIEDGQFAISRYVGGIQFILTNFTYCESNYTGCMTIQNAYEQVTINRCFFIQCRSQFYSGAIMLYVPESAPSSLFLLLPNPSVSISSCMFINNHCSDTVKANDILIHADWKPLSPFLNSSYSTSGDPQVAFTDNDVDLDNKYLQNPHYYINPDITDPRQPSDSGKCQDVNHPCLTLQHVAQLLIDSPWTIDITAESGLYEEQNIIIRGISIFIEGQGSQIDSNFTHTINEDLALNSQYIWELGQKDVCYQRIAGRRYSRIIR
ncbi:MAG: hypothetical protein EZS28_048605, partial [Streblomastix strix]